MLLTAKSREYSCLEFWSDWSTCVQTNVVRALAEVVATKLGIIIIFLSFHFVFSQKRFAYDFVFLHAFLSNKKNKI